MVEVSGVANILTHLLNRFIIFRLQCLFAAGKYFRKGVCIAGMPSNHHIKYKMHE